LQTNLLQIDLENAMTMEKTRREFLRSSAVGLAATATARALPVFSTDTAGQRGKIAAWATSQKNRFARMSGLRWRTAAAKPSEQAVVLNPEKEFQPILGFGAAFTDALATCSTSSRHPHASGCFMLHPH